MCVSLLFSFALSAANQPSPRLWRLRSELYTHNQITIHGLCVNAPVSRPCSCAIVLLWIIQMLLLSSCWERWTHTAYKSACVLPHRKASESLGDELRPSVQWAISGEKSWWIRCFLDGSCSKEMETVVHTCPTGNHQRHHMDINTIIWRHARATWKVRKIEKVQGSDRSRSAVSESIY